MKPLTLEEIARFAGGHVVSGDKRQAFSNVQIDSRLVKPGDLFWAIIGERSDGHDFVGSAAKNGALGAVVEHPVDNRAGLGLIQVSSTVKALSSLAENYLSLTAPSVIGVTGSVGKTSTKDMIGSVLSQKYRTYKNPGNLNSAIGLPLAVLGMDEDYDYLVLEMAMRRPKQIEELCHVAKPSVGVLTDISMSHIEKLGSLEGIAGAKAELLKCLPREGTAVMCGDNPLVREVSGQAPCRKVFYGFSEDVDFRAVDILPLGKEGSEFTVLGQGQRHRFYLNVPGRHQVKNALAAVAVGQLLGLSPAEIGQGLSAVDLSPMRLEVTEFGDLTVINDAYNASPSSMKAALDLLGSFEGSRKVAILGDMLELGSFGPQAHREVGAYAREKADILFAVGDLAEKIKEGWDEKSCFPRTGRDTFSSWYPDKEKAEGPLKGALLPGDVVLVKASRGMGFEDFVLFLKRGLVR